MLEEGKTQSVRYYEKDKNEDASYAEVKVLPLEELHIGIVGPHVANFTIRVLQGGEGEDGDYTVLCSLV